MNRKYLLNSILVMLAAMLLPITTGAQEKTTLGILDIKTTPALVSTLPPDKKTELDRIIQSLDGQLIASVDATHKFDIVSRSALDEVLKEQNLDASGNVDSTSASKIGALLGAKYILTGTVDDFQDYVETATFDGTGRSATKRVFRFSIVAQIYDSTTGKLLAAVPFQTGNDEFKQIQEEHNYSVKNGELSDEMMVAIAHTMAEKTAIRVADVIFPIKVLIKDDSGIMINRGDGGGIAVGDIFNVYALGQQLVDPDTKEVLGNEEVKVGQVQITEVDPKFSKAKILEDTGINTGAILRRPQ